MSNLLAAFWFLVVVMTPIVLFVVFAATTVAAGYVLFLVLTYHIERVRLDEGRKNKKLLQDIRAGRV